MARIALRNLLSKPATRRYPFVVRQPFAASRGKLEIDFPLCVFCGACSKHCPADAIHVDRAASSWSIDRFKCVLCGACVRACPKKCLALSAERSAATAFGDLAGRVESHARPASEAKPAEGPPGA